MGKNRKSFKLNTNSRSFPRLPLCIAKHVLQKLRFLCIPEISWLIDIYTIMHNEKMGKIKQVQNNHLPETFWFSEMIEQFLIFLNVFSNTKNITNLKIEKTWLSFLDLAFFFLILVPFYVLFNMKRNKEKFSQNEQGHRNLAFWVSCFSLWIFPVLFCFTIRDSVKLSRLKELKFKLFLFIVWKMGLRIKRVQPQKRTVSN